MATSGTITGSYGSGTSGLKLRASWSRTSSGIDATGPYSVITVTIEYTRTSTGYTTYKLNAPYSLEIDGAVVDSGNHTYDVRSVTANTYVTYISKTNITVRHDANGAKTATLKFTVNLSGTSAKSGAISGNIVLDSIPMNASLSLSETSFNVSNSGSTLITATITKSGTNSYYHKIIWETNGQVVKTVNVGTAVTSTAVGTSDFLQYMSSRSQQGTATLYTYSDSGYTKQVGTTSIVYFTLNLAAQYPTIAISASINTRCLSYVRGVTSALITGGYSKVACSINSPTPIISGSTITSIKWYVNGELKQNSTSTSFDADIENSTTVTISVELADSIGIAGNGSITLNGTSTPKILEYSIPSLTVTAYRTANSTSTAKSDSGTYLRITATAAAYPSGSGNAIAGIRVSSKLTTASSYGDETSLTSGTAKNISGFEAANSYDVQIRVWDKIQNNVYYHIVIPTESVTLDFPVGGKGLGIGMVATQGSNRIDTPWQYKSTKASGFGFLSEGSGGYLGLRLHNTSTDKILQFQIGNDGNARGIYDPGAGSWSYCVNADDNVFINRLRHITSAPIGSGNSCQVVFLSDPPKSVVDADATAYSDDYWKSYLKWVCETYPDQTNTLFIGRLSPSSRCIVILFIYSTAAAYVDDTTGLPQYSFGIYIPYQGTTAKDALYKFGTSGYTFYRYNPFGSVPTRSSTTTQSDIFSGITTNKVSVSSCARYVYGGVAQLVVQFTTTAALTEGEEFAAALFANSGTGAYEPIGQVGGAGSLWEMWGTTSTLHYKASRAIPSGSTIRTSFTYITHG